MSTQERRRGEEKIERREEEGLWRRGEGKGKQEGTNRADQNKGKVARREIREDPAREADWMDDRGRVLSKKECFTYHR
eukprot:765521-Hanusia_phi.AAC.3